MVNLIELVIENLRRKQKFLEKKKRKCMWFEGYGLDCSVLSIYIEVIIDLDCCVDIFLFWDCYIFFMIFKIYVYERLCDNFSSFM